MRMKSGYISYQVMSFALLFLAWGLALFRTDAWIIGMVFLLFILQTGVGTVIFRILDKRL